MACEFSAAWFSTFVSSLYSSFDKLSFSKVVPQFENYDISKIQSNPSTLAMSVVSIFVTSSYSAVITVQHHIHSCMSIFLAQMTINFMDGV